MASYSLRVFCIWIIIDYIVVSWEVSGEQLHDVVVGFLLPPHRTVLALGLRVEVLYLELLLLRRLDVEVCHQLFLVYYVLVVQFLYVFYLVVDGRHQLVVHLFLGTTALLPRLLGYGSGGNVSFGTGSRLLALLAVRVYLEFELSDLSLFLGAVVFEFLVLAQEVLDEVLVVLVGLLVD